MTIGSHMKVFFNYMILFLLIGQLYSCAGPADPFGAKEVRSVLLDNLEKIKVDNKDINDLYRVPSNDANQLIDLKSLKDEYHRINEFVTIDFNPSRQNFHGAFDFKIYIRDELGIHPEHMLKIYYNDVEISQSQYKNFVKATHTDGKGYTLTHYDFRLPVNNIHEIKALYWRDQKTSPLIKSFDEPYCDLQSKSRQIASMGSFSKHYHTFQMIRSVANEQKINPNFIAAIVAKESSFNPNAVSWAKAIGLTQVTPIAAREINRTQKLKWKVYPNTQKMSYYRLKTAVAAGLINKSNDWRLDNIKSIQGAIFYLQYLENYWEKAKDLHNISLDSKLENNLILASYNSGAARVKSAFLKEKENWFNQKDLVEAKKYFRKINSYCYSFEHQKGTL